MSLTDAIRDMARGRGSEEEDPAARSWQTGTRHVPTQSRRIGHLDGEYRKLLRAHPVHQQPEALQVVEILGLLVQAGRIIDARLPATPDTQEALLACEVAWLAVKRHEGRGDAESV